MSQFGLLKRHSPTTWITVLLALAVSGFYVDAIVQYASAIPMPAPDLAGPREDRFLARTLFEEFSLTVTQGSSILWAKVMQSLLGLIGIASALAAALLMWRTPDNKAGRQVAGLAMAYAVWNVTVWFLPWLPAYQPYQQQMRALGPFAGSMLEMLSWLLFLYLALGFARFLVIFPREVDVESVHRTYLHRPLFLRWTGNQPVEKSLILPKWHAALVSGRIFWVLPFLLVQFLVFSALHRPMLTGGLAVMASFVGIGFYVFVGLPYAFASISHLHRFGSEDERKRVAWLRSVTLFAAIAISPVVFQLVIGLLFGLAQRTLPDLISATPGESASYLLELYSVGVWVLFLPLAILALGVAVFRAGALDPRVAFTRLTLWSVLGFFVSLAFLLLERLAAAKLAQWFQLSPDLGAVVAGAAVATTFMPVRNLVSREVERLADKWVPLETAAEGERVTRVVAITDLSGYSSLSATQESAALLQSAALRRQGERVAGRHGGTFIKSLGDAVMLTFTDAKTAIVAVEDLHREFPKAVDAVGLLPLALHSALHWGEIVEARDGDIFGQTVNIAARLVDAAAPGEIVVSESLRSQTEETLAFQPHGQRKFKNVAEPVQCFLRLPSH